MIIGVWSFSWMVDTYIKNNCKRMMGLEDDGHW